MLRKSALALVSASLVLGVLAFPVSAAPAPATALEINGIPGTSIDICEGGKEVVSNFRYGKSSRWSSIVPGTHTWKIKKAAKGKCKGKRLATFKLTFTEGSTYTIVYYQPKSTVRMRVYKNNPVTLGADEAALRVIHAAKAPALEAWVWQSVPAPSAIKVGPTVEGLRKGNASKDIVVKERYTVASAYYPNKRTGRWSSESASKNLDAGWGYQLVLMGNTAKNMKLKFYRWPHY